MVQFTSKVWCSFAINEKQLENEQIWQLTAIGVVSCFYNPLPNRMKDDDSPIYGESFIVVKRVLM